MYCFTSDIYKISSKYSNKFIAFQFCCRNILPQNLLLIADGTTVKEHLLMDHGMRGMTLKLSMTDFSHMIDKHSVDIEILAPEVKTSRGMIDKDSFTTQADCYQAAMCQLDLYTKGGTFQCHKYA